LTLFRFTPKHARKHTTSAGRRNERLIHATFPEVTVHRAPLLIFTPLKCFVLLFYEKGMNGLLTSQSVHTTHLINTITSHASVFLRHFVPHDQDPIRQQTEQSSKIMTKESPLVLRRFVFEFGYMTTRNSFRPSSPVLNTMLFRYALLPFLGFSLFVSSCLCSSLVAQVFHRQDTRLLFLFFSFKKRFRSSP